MLITKSWFTIVQRSWFLLAALVILASASCSSERFLNGIETATASPSMASRLTETLSPTLQLTATGTPVPTVTPTSTVTLVPTALGGESAGAMYRLLPREPQDHRQLVIQSDLSNPATITSVLSREQITDKFGADAQIWSISPNGKTMILMAGSGLFLATVDLKFVSQIPNDQYSIRQLVWSPDGAAVMAPCGQSVCVVSQSNGKAALNKINPANLLNWSLDSTTVYYESNGLWTFDIKDGARKQVELSFIKQPKQGFAQEIILALGFAPTHEEALIVTMPPGELKRTIYKTTTGFSNPVVLATFDSSCFVWSLRAWSPDEDFVWLQGCAESDDSTEMLVKVADGSILKLSDGTPEVGFYCGWSPDNHFVTWHAQEVALWDANQPKQPVLSIQTQSMFCPVWLTP